MLTSDLVRGRVEIYIDNGGTSLASGASAPNAEGLLNTALCGGLTLYVGQRESAAHRISAYLDDD